MRDEQEFFSPERVDEQIDQLFQNEEPPRFARWQTGNAQQAEKRLLTDLKGYYRTAKQEDLNSLERAWTRVSPHLAASSERSRQMDRLSSTARSGVSQERTRPMSYHMPEPSRRQGARRWLGMLAAVLVAAVLVGGLVTVLNLSNRAKTAGQPQTTLPASTPTSTPAQAPGTTVYTTPASQNSYGDFAWSPDSKRIASFTGYGAGGLRIWDATTGGNAVTFSLPGQNEWIMSFAWSPVGQQIAVGTNKHVLIVDGQTGTIQRTYSSGSAISNQFHSPYLSSMMPNSSGAGYTSVSWSPDGKSLAVGISYGPDGVLQIWNMPAGTVAATFALGSSYVSRSMSWSPDGKYLAAHSFNTQGVPLAANDIVAVWDAATHQTIFKKTLMLDGSDAPVYWQPRSHNLAFYSASAANQPLALGLWDVLTGKKLHTYAKGNDTLAFSPDGQQIVYNTYIGTAPHGSPAAAIMDINNGTQIFTYKGSNGSLAWSPDGQYIVSAFNGQLVLDKKGMPVIKNGQMETTPSYAKVWVA